jgi:hypothetical protein
LKNRSPTSALVFKTPHEIWCGKKPSIVYPIIFGCDAFMHDPKEKRSKLDNKSEKCIFVGYKDGIKVYKLWNPLKRKIVYSRDVSSKKLRTLPKMKMNLKKKDQRKWNLK